MIAVELYPAADEQGGSNGADTDAAHFLKLHEGKQQANSYERAVKAVLDDAELYLADEGDDEHDSLTGSNKNFGTDAEKNAEGKDYGAEQAVEPLPV